MSKKYCEVCFKKCKGRTIKINENIFVHSSCFKCHECQTDLEISQFYYKNGKLYCVQDFKNLFFPKCSACLKSIENETATVIGKQYHPDCLYCSICRKTAKVKDKLNYDGKNFICQLCLEDKILLNTSGNQNVPNKDNSILKNSEIKQIINDSNDSSKNTKQTIVNKNVNNQSPHLLNPSGGGGDNNPEMKEPLLHFSDENKGTPIARSTKIKSLKIDSTALPSPSTTTAKLPSTTFLPHLQPQPQLPTAATSPPPPPPPVATTTRTTPNKALHTSMPDDQESGASFVSSGLLSRGYSLKPGYGLKPVLYAFHSNPTTPKPPSVMSESMLQDDQSTAPRFMDNMSMGHPSCYSTEDNSQWDYYTGLKKPANRFFVSMDTHLNRSMTLREIVEGRRSITVKDFLRKVNKEGGYDDYEFGRGSKSMRNKGKNFYKLEELRSMLRQQNKTFINSDNVEDYLNEVDFQELFGMSREIFRHLPLWKRNDLKKVNDLIIS